MKIHLLLPLLLSGAAMAQPAGTFIATGSMNTPRWGHTATLLQDGRVLITGGVVTGPGNLLEFTDSAELYDPATSSFAVTGNMTGPRYDHTATLLPDGRVLIAGGADGTGQLSLTAELYDPSTGTFSPTGGMWTGHWSATLLDNGEVMMGPLAPGDPVEFYHPSAGIFTRSAGLVDPAPFFIGRTITSLADGRIISPVDSPPEIYDPATGSFGLTGAMIYPHALLGQSTTLLPNGKVLFAGGAIDNEDNIGFDASYPYGVYPYGELYDPSTGSFATTGNLIGARTAHTATLLPDGSVLIAGGDAAAGLNVRTGEVYDFSAGTFSLLGDMVTARGSHTATLLKDGTVLITGGLEVPAAPAPQIALASAELYKPPVQIPAPVLFSITENGQGQGAIWHATTGLVASPSAPAVAGEALSMYTTSLIDGGVIPPQVAVGGQLAQVLYFGPAPGYPGYNQVNFLAPSGVTPGPSVPLRLTYLGRPSNEVTIAIQ
jgi:Galactose oxidase, central domain